MTSSTLTSNSCGEEGGEARAVEHARHADDPVVRQAREFAQRPDHRVERVGDADHEGVGGVLLDALADRLHHLEVDAEKVVAAHPRLARHAGGDDDHVGAGDVGIIVGAGDLRVEALDRAALADVERLALRNALGDVEQDDVAHFPLRGEVSEGSADHSGADQRDLLPSHEAAFLFCFWGRRGPAGWRRSAVGNRAVAGDFRSKRLTRSFRRGPWKGRLSRAKEVSMRSRPGMSNVRRIRLSSALRSRPMFDIECEGSLFVPAN